MFGGTDTENENGVGASLFLDLGVEFCRLERDRFSAYLRVEVPTYTISTFDEGKYSNGSSGYTYSYRMPVGLHVNVGF